MQPLLNPTPNNALICGHRIAHGAHGAGAPVVLIHGTPSCSHIWRNVAPALIAANYKTHLWDLLGYGASERPSDPAVDTSVSGQVPVLLDLLGHWQLDAAHIVAHDIGGAVAMRLAVFHPERVRSLTLIDTVSFDSWPSKRTRQQMQDGLEALIAAAPARHRAHFEEWLLSTVHTPAQLRDSGALQHYLEQITSPVRQASFFQHQVTHYHPKHTQKITVRLPELGKKPVQLLWGENDAWQITDWAHRLHAAIPNSTLHILPECGHFAMEDQPQAIATHIISFLQNHTPAPNAS